MTDDGTTALDTGERSEERDGGEGDGVTRRAGCEVLALEALELAGGELTGAELAGVELAGRQRQQ